MIDREKLEAVLTTLKTETKGRVDDIMQSVETHHGKEVAKTVFTLHHMFATQHQMLRIIAGGLGEIPAALIGLSAAQDYADVARIALKGAGVNENDVKPVVNLLVSVNDAFSNAYDKSMEVLK